MNHRGYAVAFKLSFLLSLVLITCECTISPASCAPTTLSTKAVNKGAGQSGARIDFKMRHIKEIQYSDAKDSDGNPISHSLTTLSGQGNGYRIEEQLVNGDALIALKISYGKKLVFQKKLPRWQGLCEGSMSIINPIVNEDCSKKPVACDMNNDGVPELILTENDNAGHSPDRCIILQLHPGGDLKQIYSETLQSPSFKDLDKNGSYEIIIDDQTFKYWNDASYCDLGSMEVILAAEGNTYKPSRQFMFKKAPSPLQVNAVVKDLENEIKPYGKVLKKNTKAMTPKVWTTLAEYLFSNNVDSAKQILERLYPGNMKLAISSNPPDQPVEASQIKTRDYFWSSLLAQAKKSKYLQALSPRLN